MYILITGITGVGKSSLISHLQNVNSNAYVFQDPYEENPFLTDALLKGKNAFQSEVFFVKEFIKIHKHINDSVSSYIIQERSIYECVYIFAKQYLHDEVIDGDEYNTLKDLVDVVAKDFRKPDVIIHLSADKLTVKERLVKRCRDFETETSLKMIAFQEQCYQDWLYNIQKEYDVPIIQIDNTNLTIEETLKESLKLLEKFIN